MSNIIRTSFAAGELSSDLGGRVDLAKYQVAAATMRNMFVGYRGGAISRPGTQHVGLPPIEPDLPKPRLIPFIFNADQAYALELSPEKMRIISRGSYVTFAATNVTAVVSLNPLVVTVPAHGASVGDFVVWGTAPIGLVRPNGISGVQGRTFYVSAVAGNDLTLAAQGDGVYINVDGSTWTAYVSGGSVARIIEVVTPWAADDLFTLNYAQSADVMTVTSNNYPPYNIIRSGATSWSVAQEQYSAAVPAPVLTAINGYGNIGSRQQYFFSYVVTAVDSNGRESTASDPIYGINSALDQTVNPATTNRIEWSAVAGAAKYRVYKAQPLPNGLQGGGPYFYGIVAEQYDTIFNDVNYAPDYTTGPPITRNPFLDGGLASVAIVAGGAGYVAPVAAVSGGGGTGAQVSLTADTSATATPYGEIVSAAVVVPGTGYAAPTVAVSDAAGAGTGLTLAFDGTWVANPVGANFVPGPGSITIANGGINYHAGSYLNLVTCVPTAGVVVGNSMRVRVTQVVNGVVTAIAFAWPADAIGVAANGLSTVGAANPLIFTVAADPASGTGANITAALGGTSNPACVAYHEQRKVFGGTIAAPTTTFFSRIAQFTNFNVSDPIQENDAITAALVANEVNIITALVSMTSGLVALTVAGAYLIRGGPDKAITVTTAKAEAQVFVGALKTLAPLRVGDRLLYSQARGSAVRDLAFNFVSNTYTGQDVSVMSAHLLEKRVITQWAYAEEPNKLVWMIRDDGVLLSLTYLKEQDVYGWARHDTQGRYVSVCVIPEGREDVAYFVVERYTPELGWHYATERMVSRDFGANPAANIPARAEDAWCVDNGARYTLTEPNTQILSLQMTAAKQGTLTFAAAAFSSADVGKIVRVRGGKGTVYQCPAADQLVVDWIDLPVGIPNFSYNADPPNIVLPVIQPGEWSMTTPVDVIGGLDHLNGATVQVLVDGSVHRPLVVEDGCITLDETGTRIVAGLGFTCQLQTMRLEDAGRGYKTIQGDRKNINDITIRSKDTRGVMFGSTWTALVPFAERTTEPMGEPTRLMDGGEPLVPPFVDAPSSSAPVFYQDRYSNVDGDWSTEGQICMQQSWPLPMTILAIVPDLVKGDDAP